MNLYNPVKMKKDNFPWGKYYLIVIFMVLSAVLFEIGYNIQYVIPAMEMGLDTGIVFICMIGRICLYAMFILGLSVVSYNMIKKVTKNE